MSRSFSAEKSGTEVECWRASPIGELVRLTLEEDLTLEEEELLLSDS